MPLPSGIPSGPTPCAHVTPLADTARWLLEPLTRRGQAPGPQVCVGRPEQQGERLPPVLAPLHVGEQVGQQAIVRDAVAVHVEDAPPAALAPEAEVAAVRAERV